MSTDVVSPIPIRTGKRPVIWATRVGVQEGSVYIRTNRIASSEKAFMLGVSYPRTCIQFGNAHVAKAHIVN